MEFIPVENLSSYDKASLRIFLQACQDAACEKDHFQIASISLECGYISPLAVLESIYDAEELHFYVERPADEVALAGMGAVVQSVFSGTDRFKEAKEFSETILEHTIVVGNLDVPFTGPHFFSAFSFSNTVPESNPFPSATIFMPRWQVSRCGGRYGAVANVLVDKDSDLDALVDSIWDAYDKFSAFDYGSIQNQSKSASNATARTIVKETDLGGLSYENAVEHALHAIDTGAYEKIVLSRGIELEADHAWDPIDALNRLRSRFADCFTFSFGNGAGSSFIGASPERLLRIRDGQLQTEAIAGSAPRGATTAQDAKLAQGLLKSTKDLHEHACVRDSIVRRLARVGVEGKPESGSRLLPLANVQHLRTTIKAEVDSSVHILDVASELHPTPAVGGTPREAALQALPDLEAIERGLYAGALGWFNHRNEGEIIVGIRSALIKGHSAKLYAGAGVVKGSKPEGEIRETDMKLRALYHALALERADRVD